MSDESQDSSDGAPPDRDALLRQLEASLRELRRKVEKGRVYDAETERVRIKWARALAYTVNVYRQVLNDRDLDDLEERVDEIQAQVGATASAGPGGSAGGGELPGAGAEVAVEGPESDASGAESED